MELTEVRDVLEQTYQVNRALIAGLSESEFARKTPNPRWRVRQLAAHIAEDDAGTLYVGKLLARGKNAKAPDFVINVANWWSLRKHRKATPATLLAVLDRRHGELMAWLNTLQPEQLERGGEISQLGRLTLAEFLGQNSAHSREHAADICAAIGRQESPAGA